MSAKSAILIATVFTFFSTSVAINAATINLSGILSASPASVSLAGNNSGNLDFLAEIPELSPTIGTLVSADISIQFTVSSTADVLSGPPAPGTTYVVGYTLVTSTAILPVNGFPAVSLPGMPILAVAIADPGGPVSTFTVPTNFTATSGNLPAAAVPSLQGNAGFLTVNFAMPVAFLPMDQTLEVLDGVATADGSLSVSYTYTPAVVAAEPRTGMLLLVGAAGVCLLRRFRS